MIYTSAFFSTLPGQVLLWCISAILFWGLSKLADRESLEFVILDAFVLISALVALLTVPFVFLEKAASHVGIAGKTMMGGSTWILVLGVLSLLLCADAFVQMKRFFL